MATILTKTQWINILRDKSITKDLDISIIQTLYSREGHKAPASEIGRILGFSGKKTSSPLNSEIGRYAKRIAKKYDIDFTLRANRKYKYWDLFFIGWNEGKLFIWQLRNELRDAFEDTFLTGEEYIREEILLSYPNLLTEGLKKSISVNVYERNPRARQRCIEYWKPICSVCEFDFEKKYGDLGKGFIHVHHLIPVSEIRQNYQVDPIRDLRPVCPNCHSMLHRTTPPLTIKELKEKINITSRQRRKKENESHISPNKE